MQVPVHPFVAVEESKDVTPRAEGHRLRSPRKTETVPALAPGREDDRFVERAKRDRDLQHDPALLELAERREMGPGSIAQRLDHDLVVPGPRQAGQDAARFSAREPGQLASDDHRSSLRESAGSPAQAVWLSSELSSRSKECRREA